MKRILSALALICSNIAFAQNYAVSYELIHQYSLAEINSILGATGISTFLTPTFEVDYYRVTYNTTNARGTGTTLASGAIAVPAGVSCPMPIFSYQHGTQTVKTAVPSNRAGDEFKVGLIACSAKGAIATMPDYLGMGVSTGFHPYVNSRTEASATIDLLRACRELKDSIGYNLNNQLFLLGYSQGGHSTMAAFKELETNLSNEFTVTACAPMSGPYYVSGVQAQTIIRDSSYATPSYLPYVIMGQQEAYGNLYNSLSEIFIPPYDSLLPLYFNGTRSTGYINNRLPDTPNLILDPVLFDDFKNDPNHFFRVVLRDNDLHNWRPQAPLNMYYCTQDEQVFFENSLIARDTMHALGATQVNAINLGAYTHSGCAQLCFLQGFFFFNNYADWSGGMTVSDSVIQVSIPGTSDGSISLQVNNGVGNLQFDWLDNSLTDSISSQNNLAGGNYQIRVSDSRGCYVFHNVSLGVTAVSGVQDESKFSFGPNPAVDRLNIEVPDLLHNREYTIILSDIDGRIVLYLPGINSKTFQLDLSTLNQGNYMIGIESGSYRKFEALQIIR